MTFSHLIFCFKFGLLPIVDTIGLPHSTIQVNFLRQLQSQCLLFGSQFRLYFKSCDFHLMLNQSIPAQQ